MAPPQTDIWLLTASTPNGQKISMQLEELGIKYETKKINIGENEQKEEWFLKINPNGRIPAILDRTVSPPVPVFESGAIMLYLCEKYDPDHLISYAYNTPNYWKMVQWLFFMNAGVGPMQGQANHFHRYAPEKIPYAINRYQNETARLYGVLDKQLAEQAAKETVGGDSQGKGPWLVGDKMTIADIANFGWVNWAAWAGVDTNPFSHLKDWVERMNAREGIKRGLDVPDSMEKLKQRLTSKEAEEEAKQQSAWILKNQEEDSNKYGKK